MLTAREFFPVYFYPSSPFTCIFIQNLSRFFPVLANSTATCLALRGMGSARLYLPKTHRAMTTHNHTITDRSPPGSTRTAPSAVHRGGGVNCATGASSKIRGRDNINIGTWNTRTLRTAGKLQELTHEMDRYDRTSLGSVKCDGRTLAKQQQRKDTRLSSVEKRINTGMALNFLFTRTS